jgi:hypothetical protein
MHSKETLKMLELRKYFRDAGLKPCGALRFALMAMDRQALPCMRGQDSCCACEKAGRASWEGRPHRR